MDFSQLAGVFDKLSSKTKRLDLASDLAKLFASAGKSEVKQLAYLCQGRLLPEHVGIELGIGDKLAEQAIAKVAGRRQADVEASYRKTGDLGETARLMLEARQQTTLFEGRKLTVGKVYSNLDKLARSSGSGSQDQKVNLLAELLNSSSPSEAGVIIGFVTGNLRLGVGEPTILDGIASVEVAKRCRDVEKLKAGSAVVAVDFVDFSESSVVFRAGDEVAAKGLKGKEIELVAAGGKVVFSSAVEKVDGERIIVRGLDEKVKFREALERAFNLRSDLGLVVELYFEKGISAVEAIGPEVFSPIRPALAERLESADAIFQKLGVCAVEQKYDGFRLQIHKKGNEVRIFSRRQEPMTHMFPDIVAAVLRQVKARECVFEGEAIAYDDVTGEFKPFQATIQRKRKHGVEAKAAELPLKLFAFELLLADGKDLTQLPFKERRKKLEEMFSPGELILPSNYILAKSGSQLEEFFDQSVSSGLEGIIAKDLSAPYAAGARKFAWIKFKRSYSGRLADTIDAVVIGYYYGKGKRTKFGFGGLLTAVFDPASRSFKSIAKVGTGFTEVEMAGLKERLDGIAVKRKPDGVETLLEPDVWVKPQLVVTLTADEITRSPIHACAAGKVGGKEGLALRFPRLTAIREDRSAEDATTEKEVIELFEMQGK